MITLLKNGFSAIYESWFGLYNQTYDLIFTTFYNDGGYIKFGLSFILIPLVCWLIFYYAWRYPYGKIWHWLIWLIIVSLLVFGTTWGITNSEIFASSNQDLIDALADSKSGYEVFASSLPLKYSLINGCLTLIISFIYSLIMKQFSKIQIHLPF
jgi:hypothetical protein